MLLASAILGSDTGETKGSGQDASSLNTTLLVRKKTLSQANELVGSKRRDTVVERQ